MSESCNSRHFSWLVKSCLPNPNDTAAAAATLKTISHLNPNDTSAVETTVSFLPDDVLLECLSRVPSSSIQALSLVCLRWRALILSPSFFHLRRRRNLLRLSLLALSSADSAILSASLPFPAAGRPTDWNLSTDAVAPSFPPHARICASGPTIFAVGRGSALRYDTWTGAVAAVAPTLFPRKKFAVAEVAGKIYVAGGGGAASSTAVEEYEPGEDAWRVVGHAARSRYGCVGASAEGVFYVVGGLRLGGSGGDSHVYAGSMDLFDVEAGAWLRSRSVPGGGCVVAACGAAGRVYVLTSHAVELSFWSFDGRRKGNAGGFGEWRRLRSPPLPTQVRVRFSCVGVGEKVVLLQVSGCIDDLLRRSGRSGRGLREALVLIYDPAAEEWSRAPDLPELIRRPLCVALLS